jgi:hypothetical protein
LLAEPPACGQQISRTAAPGEGSKIRIQAVVSFGSEVSTELSIPSGHRAARLIKVF